MLSGSHDHTMTLHLIVATVGVVDVLEQDVFRQKLADDGSLARVVGDAFNSEANLE
jgi:hypothetical protein